MSPLFPLIDMPSLPSHVPSFTECMMRERHVGKAAQCVQQETAYKQQASGAWFLPEGGKPGLPGWQWSPWSLCAAQPTCSALCSPCRLHCCNNRIGRSNRNSLSLTRDVTLFMAKSSIMCTKDDRTGTVRRCWCARHYYYKVCSHSHGPMW